MEEQQAHCPHGHNVCIVSPLVHLAGATSLEDAGPLEQGGIPVRLLVAKEVKGVIQEPGSLVGPFEVLSDLDVFPAFASGHGAVDNSIEQLERLDHPLEKLVAVTLVGLLGGLGRYRTLFWNHNQPITDPTGRSKDID